MEANSVENFTISYFLNEITRKNEKKLLPLPLISQFPDRLSYTIKDKILQRKNNKRKLEIKIPSKLTTILHTNEIEDLKYMEKAILVSREESNNKSDILIVDLEKLSENIKNKNSAIKINELLKVIKHNLKDQDIVNISEKIIELIDNKLTEPSIQETFLILLDIIESNHNYIFLLLNWKKSCFLKLSSIKQYNSQNLPKTILLTSSEIHESLESADYLIVQNKNEIIYNGFTKSFLKEKIRKYFSKESILLIEAENITKSLLNFLRKEKNISLISFFVLNTINYGKIMLQQENADFNLVNIIDTCLKYDLRILRVYEGKLSFSDLLNLEYYGGLIF